MTKDTIFNKAISKPTKSAPDFMTLEHFSLKTGMDKAHIKWIISKRKSNGANSFLYQIGRQQNWMLSPSLYQKWKERRTSEIQSKLEKTNDAR